MKSITMNAIVTSIGSRVDGSLGLRIVTPELTHEEKVTVMELQGLNVEMLLNPMDSEPTSKVTVEKTMDTKTQSQRIRSVLFLLWKHNGEQGRFEDYYHNKTETYIEFLKGKLETL